VKPAVVSVWRVLQIFGVICLTIVVLTHVAETLHLFPAVGMPDDLAMTAAG